MTTALIRVIRWYQSYSRSGASSPFLLGGYSGCRSWPTCSEYAIDAIERQGVVRGGLRALIRVLRCNPLVRTQASGT